MTTLPARLIAIDFETANERRDSPCAVGLAWIEGGRVVRREARLIRPAEMRFSPGNIRVHGIRPRDVARAPAFPEAMAPFLPELAGSLVLAHNASFDVGVLAATLAAYGLAQPAYASLCTLQLARQHWPGEPAYRLSALADRIGLRFRHHDAGEDAYACAEIALAILRESGAPDLAALGRRLGLSRERAGQAAPAPGGIAARALRALPPAPRRPGLRFVVRGSSGTPYDVVLVKGRDGPRLRCSCAGSRYRPDCRHVTALANGEVDALLSGNPADVAALRGLLGCPDMNEAGPRSRAARPVP
ncbi:3'-5' exonuclease DinG [Methylobacterium crusticola]|uniref:3'-5' exonuclease DinG n=1 Tax=Methylobacterium crusticola TaxID=1697972 RepID=A0ABQ4QYA5_9HYPH|nr:3'-5' exonuclease [Methylobacterium crusticola]GJD50397.1 3'-5' exonuclease DinG [Methylobacterium crusticola]